MSHIFINEYPVLTFEFEPFIDKYWNIGLSKYIIEQYGKSTTYEHEKVEKILMSCFEYFIGQRCLFPKSFHCPSFMLLSIP